MVTKISKIFSVLFLFFFLACSSNGSTPAVDDDTADTTPETHDTSDPAADDGDTAENIDDGVEHGASSDEDPVIGEDYDGFADEDDAPFEDSEHFSDDDFDFEYEETDDETDEGTDVPDEESDNFDGETVQLRIVAGNITSGNNQSYDPGHGIRIFQALKPDIALVQEMNYGSNTSSDYKQFAQKIVGTNYYAVDDADYDIPNGVVSRYPITSHGYWKDPNINNRALMWAVVDIPGKKDIFAISVHLHTSPASDQTKAALVIVDEISKLKSSKPDKYYYVVGGDFNGETAVSSSGFGKNNTFYINGPDPVDEEGNAETNRNRNKLYDFVLADHPLHEFQIPVVYYSSEDSTKTKIYENGLVFDTRVYSQSELDEYFSPAQTGDSGASSMQHMAVVKDFLIQMP